MRGRRERVLLAATVMAVGLVASLPASAQTADAPVTTTTDESTTTSHPPITLLPTTTTTVDESPSPSTSSTSTTTARTPTTATSHATPSTTGPVITLPRSTTTTELREPAGPVELPTTTSLPPKAKDVDEGISVGWIVLAVVSALLLLALALSVFTYRFWRSTAPTAGGPVADGP